MANMYETPITKEQALAILQDGDPVLVTAPYADEIVDTVISVDDLGRDMDIDWETITQEEQDQLVRDHFDLMLERFENFYRERLDPEAFEFFAVDDRPDLQISLAAARVNAGLMQKEAADLIGVTELTIINWEAGRYKPSPERYPAIEKAYGLPIDNIKV